MAPKPEKTKHFNFYILNVKIRREGNSNDASPEDYRLLLKRVYAKKIHEESSSTKHCIFRFVFEEKNKETDEVDFLHGTFAQFTFIENEKWFNLNSLDIDEEFKVPDGLFPDAKITDFVFIPQAHRFCYKVSSSFNYSPYNIKKFLEKAFDKVTEKGVYVEVDVEHSRAAIDEIMAARELRKLFIDINYSNLDIGDDLKKFVEDDIKASNTRRLKIEATQKPNVSIKVPESKILSGALEASISNGEAEALILDENNRVKHIKTTHYPKKENVRGTASRFNQLVFEKIMQLFRPHGKRN